MKASGKEAREALNCISDCFLINNPIPEWAQKALINAVARVNSFQVKSWDEVFGRPLEKGKQLEAQRRKFELMEQIFQRVQERHEAGEFIVKGLFESVGQELGIGGTVASKIYYDAKDLVKKYDAEIFNYAIKNIE